MKNIEEIIKNIIVENYKIININIGIESLNLNTLKDLNKNDIRNAQWIKFRNNKKSSTSIFYVKIKKKAFKYAVTTRFLENNEKTLLRCIWSQQINVINTFSMVDSNPAIFYSAIEKTKEFGIFIYFVSKQSNSKFDTGFSLFNELIENIEIWSERTYEGRNVPFAFIIKKDSITKCPSGDNSSFYKNIKTICKFLQRDASALLTDGITSYFKIGDEIKYEVVTPYIPAKTTDDAKNNHIPLAPFKFIDFANICDDENLGIVMTIHGEVLLFHEKKLVFARRVNKWTLYDYNIFNKTLFDDTEITQNAGQIREIYLTCLDVAFARTGGTLAIVKDEEKIENIKKLINDSDLFMEFATQKDNFSIDT